MFGVSSNERDLNIAKAVILIDKCFEKYITKFSRRDFRSLKKFAAKPCTKISSSDEEIEIISKTKLSAKKTRHTAINLENKNTVEFRIFKGTLKRNTIIASIQWVDAIIDFCKKTDLKEIISLPEDVLWRNIFKDVEDKKELKRYLKRKNLN